MCMAALCRPGCSWISRSSAGACTLPLPTLSLTLLSLKQCTLTAINAAPRVSRLPGLPSSHLGLQSMTGELDEFCFDSYLGLPEQSENAEADMHSVMEAQLKAGTQPVTRAIL